MKYLVLAGALAFTLCAGVCEGEDAKAKGSPAGSTVAKEAAGSGTGLKHIDTGDDLNQNVDSMGVMSAGQNYDQNTGFPDTVPSDSDMDL